MSAQIVPHTDEHICHVENGEVHEHRVEHIHNVAKAHAVDEVADAAAQDARERPLAERMAHDLREQPREHSMPTAVRMMSSHRAPEKLDHAAPVVVHAREPQQRRQQAAATGRASSYSQPAI